METKNSKKNVQLGQLVQGGQTLFSIVNDSSTFITANFKETQLDKMKVGQKVDIIIDAEAKYNIEIDYDSADKMINVGSCVDVIAEKLKQK